MVFLSYKEIILAFIPLNYMSACLLYMHFYFYKVKCPYRNGRALEMEDDMKNFEGSPTMELNYKSYLVI